MRRTTVLLPDELAELLDYERRRQDRPTAFIVREALERYLAGNATNRRRLSFAALGGSGRRDTGQRAEAILAREWGGGRRKKKPAGHDRGR